MTPFENDREEAARESDRVGNHHTIGSRSRWLEAERVKKSEVIMAITRHIVCGSVLQVVVIILKTFSLVPYGLASLGNPVTLSIFFFFYCPFFHSDDSAWFTSFDLYIREKRGQLRNANRWTSYSPTDIWNISSSSRFREKHSWKQCSSYDQNWLTLIPGFDWKPVELSSLPCHFSLIQTTSNDYYTSSQKGGENTEVALDDDDADEDSEIHRATMKMIMIIYLHPLQIVTLILTLFEGKMFSLSSSLSLVSRRRKREI